MYFSSSKKKRDPIFLHCSDPASYSMNYHKRFLRVYAQKKRTNSKNCFFGVDYILMPLLMILSENVSVHNKFKHKNKNPIAKYGQ